MNPARTFGPAVIRSKMANQWVALAKKYLNLSKIRFFLHCNYSVDTTHHNYLLFQVYWLGPMCGGIAAALIYDFLLCPRSHNLSRRRYVLLNGAEDENDAAETAREGNSSPGPSQWPKWASCCDTQLLLVMYAFSVVFNQHVYLFKFSVSCFFSIYDKRNIFPQNVFYYYFEICHKIK